MDRWMIGTPCMPPLVKTGRHPRPEELGTPEEYLPHDTTKLERVPLGRDISLPEAKHVLNDKS
jgi:hypothetical protein